MKIKRLYINNYKSLVDFELIEPNPFSVFVGPNAAGKSNIFEALEFLSYSKDFSLAHKLFEGAETYLNKNFLTKFLEKEEVDVKLMELKFDDEFGPLTSGSKYIFKDKLLITFMKYFSSGVSSNDKPFVEWHHKTEERFDNYSTLFSRIFINQGKARIDTNGSSKLRIDADNLEPVLHRILQDEIKREEINEWVETLIPELEKIDVVQSELSGDYFLRIFEKHLDEPIGKNLISDGTYNILALLTAVYQSDEPQFLCIEEPENGLNPFVIQEMVNLFRQVCEENGHYIWLNTHSPTLVRELQAKEIILIDKKKGVTKAKQIQHDLKLYSLKLDEAWLSNALGGGLPW